MPPPPLSIITVVRNAAGTIQNCLASVQGQSIQVEHIVVDGKSTDGTLDILAEAQARNPRLVVISESDKGIYDAMSKGIQRARGEVIGCLNADDFYAAPTVLEQVSGLYTDPTLDSSYGDLLYVRTKDQGPRTKDPRRPQDHKTTGLQDEGPKTRRNRESVVGSPRLTSETNSELRSPVSDSRPPSDLRPPIYETIVRRWRAGAMSPRAFYWGWMPPHPTFFVRRRVYDQHGLFRLDLGTAADYELMLRFLVKHRISTRYLPVTLVKMRVGGVSNRSLRNRLDANRNDRRAWAVNGLRPYPWTLLLKPVRKLGQWLGAKR